MKATNRTHQNMLAMWNPDIRVLERIVGSGFDVVYKMGSSMRPDMNLFMSFIHRYSLEYDCFILGDTMITPTLDDVARIMGLPIDGRPVTGKDFKQNKCERLCRKLLGSVQFVRGKSRSQIKLKSLYELIDVPVDVSDKDLDIHVRVFVLHVIGCLICPSVDASSMPSMFLSVVGNIDEIKTYAWGAAFLAHKMNQIKLFKASRNRTVIPACVPFFMVFLFEYIEGIALVSLRKEAQLNLPSEFPLVVSWSILSSKFSRDNYNKMDQARYDSLLEESRIVSRPFDRLSTDFLPSHLQAQMDVAYTHTLLICFEQIACHMPHVCPAKMGLLVDDIVQLPLLPAFRIVKRTYPGKQDWAAKFAEQIECWNNRRLHYICHPQRLNDLGILAPVLRNGEADEETNIARRGGGARPVLSPNYAVNTEGLRRGKRHVHSPHILNEGSYEVDKKRMDQIRKKRQP